MNARSIRNKIPDLQLLARDIDPDIISVTESWLSNDFDSSSLGLLGYNIFRTDRNYGEDPHGGVFLAVKSTLHPKLMESDPNNELLIVNIRVGTICKNIITAYRTTAMNTNRNIEFVDAVRSKIENEINFVIIGDLNYPGIDWEALSSNCGSERYFLD